jgi:hypothetical protein
MAEQIPTQCAPVAAQIEALEEERRGLQEELAEAPPPLKAYYRREIRKINVELGRLRQELRACQQQHPPAPRPDLVAQAVALSVNHATRKLGVAAVVKNAGLGNAQGPFRIDLSVTLLRGGITTSVVHTFEVPAGVILYGEQVVSPSVFAAIPGGVVGGGGVGGVLPREYVTEKMEVPLYYRDESPSCVYDFEFLADAEHTVAETNEANNTFHQRWWTSTPGAPLREVPFVVESLEAVK